jgi:hypothetical protein
MSWPADLLREVDVLGGPLPVLLAIGWVIRIPLLIEIAIRANEAPDVELATFLDPHVSR